MVFNDAYLPFLKTQKRWAILYGGSGSSKSYTATQKVIMRCLQEPNTRHAIVRKWKASLRESVFALTKSIILESGMAKFVRINETEMKFHFSSGSSIICFGISDQERIKSLAEVCSITVEEATELERSDLNQLNLRLRGKEGLYKQMVLCLNPISELHFIKEMFFDKEDDSVYKLHTTYKDNTFIDAAYAKELEDRYKDDPNLARVYLRGEWGRIITNREFYSGFNHDKHTKKQIMPVLNECLHLSWDFNVVPYLPVLVSQVLRSEDDDGNVFWDVNVIDEITMFNPKNTVESAVDEFLLRYSDIISPPIFITGDASGYARSVNNNLHSYEIIQSMMGEYMSASSLRVPRTNPSIVKRRQFINRVLSGFYPIRINISKKCKTFIADLENVMEDADGKKEKKVVRDKESGASYQKYGHLSDAFDYFLCSTFENFYDNYQYVRDR